jgi:hypothetical protein
LDFIAILLVISRKLWPLQAFTPIQLLFAEVAFADIHPEATPLGFICVHGCGTAPARMSAATAVAMQALARH